MRKAQAQKGEIVLLAIEAISVRARPPSAIRSIIKHVAGLIDLYLETRGETKADLTGDQPLVLVREYLESLAEIGRAAPAAAKRALAVRPEALGVDWPLPNPLLTGAVSVETNEAPRQAPSMRLSTVKSREEISTNDLVAPYKRAYASGILPMTYASLMCSEAQRLRSFGVNGDAVYGTLLSRKTKKHRAPQTGGNRFSPAGSAVAGNARRLSQSEWRWAVLRGDENRPRLGAGSGRRRSVQHYKTQASTDVHSTGPSRWRSLYVAFAEEPVTRGIESAGFRPARTQCYRPLAVILQDARAALPRRAGTLFLFDLFQLGRFATVSLSALLVSIAPTGLMVGAPALGGGTSFLAEGGWGSPEPWELVVCKMFNGNSAT